MSQLKTSGKLTKRNVSSTSAMYPKLLKANTKSLLMKENQLKSFTYGKSWVGQELKLLWIHSMLYRKYSFV